uniref:Uncharacterized protein n=1 Tax=Cynoglossus semilaevis TaxID=244447 RepID=A0A3P8VXL7_CYNSE
LKKFMCFYSVPSNSRIVMLLGQLERMTGEAMVKDVETARQVTGKILHLIQTQGESLHRHTHIHFPTQSLITFCV